MPQTIPAPTYIQRKRTKGFKMPPNTIYVGRPTKWGNPYCLVPSIISKNKTRVDIIQKFKTTHINIAFALPKAEATHRAINLYELYILRTIKHGNLNLSELKGKNLACFCPPGQPCHAHILLKLANQKK